MSLSGVDRSKQQAWLLRAAASLVVLLVGCSETVGFLTVDLLVPSRSPQIICDKDPRRAESLEVRASCGGQSVREKVKVSDQSCTLSDVPLGECTIEVKAVNAHKRTVLSGSAVATITSGENQAVKLQLVEERCDTPSCDPDGDQLATTDEQSLGTDPDLSDTDGDGLEDGVELLQCCTDPTHIDGKCRELLIQRVEPGMGPEGTPVMLKASAPLDKPQVEVGGKPLTGVIADSTIAFGMVATGSVLGEVVLTTGGSRVTHSDLFAVLRGQPESVAEISAKATGLAPVVYQLVDQSFIGPRQFFLGRSFVSASGSGDTAPIVIAILVLVDYQQPVVAKAIVALNREPVAVAAAGDSALVLLKKGEQAELVLFEVKDVTGGLGPGKTVTFKDPKVLAAMQHPVELVLEPAGDVAQVLLRDGLVRFELDGGVAGPAKRLSFENLPILAPAGPMEGSGGCVGMALAGANAITGAANAVTFLACNGAAPCPPGELCPGQALLVRVPVKGCLALDSATVPDPTDPNSLCGTVHPVPEPGAAVGNPVVDKQTVYMLTGSGVVTASVATGAPVVSTLVPLQWTGKSSGTDVMALAGSHLFVVDGPRVWRMEPGATGAEQRKGKPFVVGRGTEEVQAVMASPDGSTLGVAVQAPGGPSWVAGICLKPCK
jgi:hypothetical protein